MTQTCGRRHTYSAGIGILPFEFLDSYWLFIIFSEFTIYDYIKIETYNKNGIMF